MKRALQFLADVAIVVLPPLLRDGAGLAGAGLVAYGARLVYLPAGYIVGGFMLLSGAWALGRRAS